MTAAEFDAVMLLINHMSAERRAAARLALVDGKTERAIAANYGWQRTAVNNAEAAVWRVHERYLAAKAHEANTETPLPRGSGRLTIAGPRGLLRKIAIDVALNKLDKG